MNLRIPADLAIAGFNDLEASALVDPGITSVASPRFAMGQQAVELLMQKASGAQTEFSADRRRFQHYGTRLDLSALSKAQHHFRKIFTKVKSKANPACI